jgi:hypothetical protein
MRHGTTTSDYEHAAWKRSVAGSFLKEPRHVFEGTG